MTTYCQRCGTVFLPHDHSGERGTSEAKPLQALSVFKALLIERHHSDAAESQASRLDLPIEMRTSWVARANEHADQIQRLRRLLFTTMVANATGPLCWSGYEARIEYRPLSTGALALRIEKMSS